MDDRSSRFLEELLAAPSPSGFEQPAQRVVRGYLEPHAEVSTDVMGNVYARIPGPEGGKRVMVVGHVDEIGFMVRYVDDRGFIFFAPIGGVDPHLVPGQRVTVWTRGGAVPGVVGKKPIHLMEAKDRETVVKMENQYIDIGARDRKEAESLVRVGDPVTFSASFQRLHGSRVAARGFDDKAGVFVTAEVVRRVAESGERLPVELVGVSSVQEEIGLRGGTTSSYTVKPDVGICVEVDFATDQPDVEKKHNGETALGKGPILSRGANINPVLHDLLVETAEELGIPYQLTGIPRATGTDANPMQISRGGVATALVKIPLRSMHTPSEVLDTGDLEHAVALITGVLRRITPDISLVPM